MTKCYWARSFITIEIKQKIFLSSMRNITLYHHVFEIFFPTKVGWAFHFHILNDYSIVFPLGELSIGGIIKMWNFPKVELSIGGIFHRWNFPWVEFSIDGIFHRWNFPQVEFSIGEIGHSWNFP